MTREEREQRRRENIAQAQLILRGADDTPDNLEKLAKRLKNDTSFGYGWKILSRARRKPEVRADRAWDLRLAQMQAVCTYKDPDLPADQRLDRALEILREADDLKTTANQETLGLAGAINKRRWELDGQKQHLERALAFYRRGHAGGVGTSDNGYTGINAAFVLDLLAEQEEREAAEAFAASETASARREEARRIREEIVAELEAKVKQPGEEWLAGQWWFLVTVAEAYFGLQRYDAAREWLRRAKALEGVPEWEYETTARQLARLARLAQLAQSRAENNQAQIEESAAWDVLKEFLGHNVEALRNVLRGKVGLALSGGGFRASLYHIGVLAKLAELDVLRHVEALSCVSGGSIIGAHYYLEVRRLLEEKEDHAVTREDYVEIVRRVEQDFLAGVQTNVRTRVAAEWWTNVRMIFSSNYSRTMRVGELYEKQIYSRITDRPAAEKKEPRWLNELAVRPKGEPESFAPKRDNWRRAAKVPILVLNATSLNTGHNWQFTASWMGEPPAAIDADVDGNYRLRRMYYGDAPPAYQKFRLGYAVAASSCVPGLFEPLALPGLYERAEAGEKITVRLVDGGVHDNQGTTSLLEQGCTVLLVSDASGQMDACADPSSGTLGVLLRSTSISQARVREAQYRELAARKRAALLQGLMFIHLKMDLSVDPVDWVNCPDPFAASEDARPAEQRGPLARYGLSKEMQRRIAAIRTDLDSFSDAEAWALMTSGYCMTEYCFPRDVPGFPPPAARRESWRFLACEKAVQQLDGGSTFARLLDVAGSLAFKIWKLSRPLKVGAAVLAAAVIVVAAWFYEVWWNVPMLTFGAVASALLAIVAGKLLGPTIVRAVNYRKTLEEVGVGLGMSVLGFAAARLHLHVFDKLYLRRGRLK
jgi:predicted acylesterase/phospholipase RssA